MNVDTNAVGRIAHTTDPDHGVAVGALQALVARGDVGCVVPQVFYEFWVVATRPATKNGFGFDAGRAEAELRRLEGILQLLPEDPLIYEEWKSLVTHNQVLGKTAHDARLVAAMTIHRITHLMTFNTRHFSRYAKIAVIDPRSLVAPPQP